MKDRPFVCPDCAERRHKAQALCLCGSTAHPIEAPRWWFEGYAKARAKAQAKAGR